MEQICTAKAKVALNAYFADFWGNVSNVYNRCDLDSRPLVKQEILALSERIRALMNKEN